MTTLRIFWCIVAGHNAKQCGCASNYHSFFPEYETWFECRFCKEQLSEVFDETKIFGRIKSWWYQE